MDGKTMVLLSGKKDILSELKEGTTPTPSVDDVVSSVGTSSTGSLWQLLGLVFLLIIILVAAYYTSKFIANFKMGQLKKSNFQVIDSYRISANKLLQIIKVGNKFLVIAVGKDTITLLTELEESEVMIREFHQGDRQNFKQILEKFKNNSE